MAVVGVLVETEVSGQHNAVTHLVAEIAQRDLHDAVGIPGARADCVLRGRHAEQHDRGDAEVGELAHLLPQRLARVLQNPGERADRLGLVDAFADEERRDEIVDAHLGLGDETPHGGRAAKPTGSTRGERHTGILRPGAARTFGERLGERDEHGRHRVLVGHRGNPQARARRGLCRDRADADDHPRDGVDTRGVDERAHGGCGGEEDRVRGLRGGDPVGGSV